MTAAAHDPTPVGDCMVAWSIAQARKRSAGPAIDCLLLTQSVLERRGDSTAERQARLDAEIAAVVRRHFDMRRN